MSPTIDSISTQINNGKTPAIQTGSDSVWTASGAKVDKLPAIDNTSYQTNGEKIRKDFNQLVNDLLKQMTDKETSRNEILDILAEFGITEDSVVENQANIDSLGPKIEKIFEYIYQTNGDKT